MTSLRRVGLPALAMLATAGHTLAGVPSLQPLATAFTGAPGCGHVLDLMRRYGPLEGLPPAQGGMVVPSPNGPFVLPTGEIGDLCLASLTESAASDPAGAPTFLVAVTNSSCRAVCNVQVSVVALLGPIGPWNPTANVCLEEIPPGGTVEVVVTLPVEALLMGSNGGAPVGFQKLLVAIDATDRFVETDEANNLRLVCRSAIPRQVIEVAAPVVVEPAPDVAGLQPQPVPVSLDAALEEFGLDAQGEAAAARL